MWGHTVGRGVPLGLVGFLRVCVVPLAHSVPRAWLGLVFCGVSICCRFGSTGLCRLFWSMLLLSLRLEL